jgi:DNA-binding transcriptional ArsR family regulator
MNKSNHYFLNEDTVLDVANRFKALSDPTRVKILHLLMQEECSVGHIAEVLKMSPSAVSHQLTSLKGVKLVKFRREKQTFYYSIEDEHGIEILQQMINHSLHD